jgi:predicted regulator of Ras-like GTPase activity (Roadblock/LC7/MglB family)
MSSYIPAGRLAAVDHGGQKIEIQTEFSKYPEPRIATAVSLAGRVIHKIQKLWGKQIETLEELRSVEELIRKQHAEVVALVNEHAATLVAHSAKLESPKPNGSEILDRVCELSDVDSAFIVTADGGLTAKKRVTKEAELLANMISQLTDVLFEMARASNFGECEDCIINLGSHDLLLLPFQQGYLAVLVGEKVRKREILESLWKIVRSAA